MLKSDSIKELAGALSKAQAVIAGASKDATNPHFNRSYASLASVWDACRAALVANGLAVAQAVSSADGKSATVTTTLMHTSGEWMSDSLTMIPEKATCQGLGSAITYARRYALAAIVGVSPADDDGNEASGPPSNPPPAQRATPPRAEKPKAVATGKAAFAAVVKEWSGCQAVDLGAAALTAAKRLGYPDLKGLAELAYDGMTAEMNKARPATTFAEWAAQPPAGAAS